MIGDEYYGMESRVLRLLYVSLFCKPAFQKTDMKQITENAKRRALCLCHCFLRGILTFSTEQEGRVRTELSLLQCTTLYCRPFT